MNNLELTKIIKDFNKKVEAKEATFADWQGLLALQPPVEEIKTMKYGEKFEYVDIRYCENLADMLFKNEWSITVNDFQTVFNAIAVVANLTYKHPITGIACKMDGVGAENVQLDGGAKALEFEKLKQNAVVLALPIAKATAVKNAFKSLGNIFGRSLKDKETLNFVQNAEVLENEEAKLLQKISTTENLETLNIILTSPKYSYNVKEAAKCRLVLLEKY